MISQPLNTRRSLPPLPRLVISGGSESVCTARVLSDSDAYETRFDAVAAEAPPPEWDEEAEVSELLTVDPQAEDPLAAVTGSVTDMRKARLRVPAGTTWVRYMVRRAPMLEVPGAVTPVPAPTLAHLRLGHQGRPALTEATTLAHLLRSALQKRLRGSASPVLSGHEGKSPRRDQHAHAHYLALPEPGGGRIDHLFVWAPEGLGPREVEAIGGLRELRLRDAPEPIQVALVALGRIEHMTLPHLAGPCRRWRSLTPVALSRHEKRRGGRVVDGPVEQVRRELAWRGLPEPTDVELIHGRWMDFKRVRPGRSQREAARTVGVRLTFAESVSGPIAIGGLSHFGLGLLVPDP